MSSSLAYNPSDPPEVWERKAQVAYWDMVNAFRRMNQAADWLSGQPAQHWTAKAFRKMAPEGTPEADAMATGQRIMVEMIAHAGDYPELHQP